MTTFTAPAKINLSLRVLERRDDGFHTIETLMVPVGICDTLEIETEKGAGIRFTCTDASIPSDASNLVIRAARDFFHAATIEPGVRISLRKNIPHGAGLGGGSSDAATTLLALNGLFGMPLSFGALTRIAAGIGSDVPFFLYCGAAWCRGRGELVEPASISPAFPILLIKPSFGVPTPWAYQRWRDSVEIPGVPYGSQKCAGVTLINDLERPVFEKFAQLAAMKSWLLAQPETAAALMSGSGSTMFAILRDASSGPALEDKARAEFGPHTWLALTVAGAAE